MRLNQYMVISNDGYYARHILQQFPDYQGIDRCLWPLQKEDLKRIGRLPYEQKISAEKYLREMGEYGEWNINAGQSNFCSDASFVRKYLKLCEILGVNAELFIGKLYSIEQERESFEIYNDEYLFMGYDFVLSSGNYSHFDGTYSCLIQEKHLIDKIEFIGLNENGLLCSLQDALKFADLREAARKENNGIGFEAGDSKDYDILALFKHI